jgi:HK97 gp10 family phage protein
MDDFERWAGALKTAADKAVDETAVAIRDDAKENAPVDTGALRASIHVSTPQRSDYGLAVTEAMALGGEKRFGPQFDSEIWGPRIGPEEPLRGSELYAIAKVTTPLNYAQFVEHGYFNVRANRYIAGRPFLQNAEDKNKALLDKFMEAEIARIQ